jgi:hypothetical protein
MLMLSHASQVPLVELPLLPVAAACHSVQDCQWGPAAVPATLIQASHSSPVYKGNQMLGMMGRMVASGRYYKLKVPP